ncbi:MAG TPA: hypothetical protein VHP30_15655 [Ignavibacteriales bacterium]|nr:hypothetical protein [Ignavibacteriales bacterium]
MSGRTRALFIAGNILMIIGFYIRIFHFEDAYFIPGVAAFLAAILLIVFSSVTMYKERKAKHPL